MIEVRALTKSYGARTVVDGVSFEVDEGEIFGILGPNGAGKTTTVECIEGLRAPDGGTIRVLGHDPQRDGTELRGVLGAQLQESRLPDRLQVREAVDLYASFYEDPADGDELLGLLGLDDQRRTRFGRRSRRERHLQAARRGAQTDHPRPRQPDLRPGVPRGTAARARCPARLHGPRPRPRWPATDRDLHADSC